MMILKSDGAVISTDARCIQNIIGQMRGLMFKRHIGDNYALIFYFKKKRIVDLHMLFVPFSIDVLLLDGDLVIMDTATLRPWVGYYKSKKKGTYVVEMKAGVVVRCGLKVGDRVCFAMQNLHI